jgi:hypothetical protein
MEESNSFLLNYFFSQLKDLYYDLYNKTCKRTLSNIQGTNGLPIRCHFQNKRRTPRE